MRSDNGTQFLKPKTTIIALLFGIFSITGCILSYVAHYSMPDEGGSARKAAAFAAGAASCFLISLLGNLYYGKKIGITELAKELCQDCLGSWPQRRYEIFVNHNPVPIAPIALIVPVAPGNVFEAESCSRENTCPA